MPPTRDEGEKRRGKMGGMSRYGVLWVLYKIFDDIKRAHGIAAHRRCAGRRITNVHGMLSGTDVCIAGRLVVEDFQGF